MTWHPILYIALVLAPNVISPEKWHTDIDIVNNSINYEKCNILHFKFEALNFKTWWQHLTNFFQFMTQLLLLNTDNIILGKPQQVWKVQFPQPSQQISVLCMFKMRAAFTGISCRHSLGGIKCKRNSPAECLLQNDCEYFVWNIQPSQPSIRQCSTVKRQSNIVIDCETDLLATHHYN